MEALKSSTTFRPTMRALPLEIDFAPNGTSTTCGLRQRKRKHEGGMNMTQKLYEVDVLDHVEIRLSDGKNYLRKCGCLDRRKS